MKKINEYLSGRFFDDRCAKRDAFMLGLNIAKQLNEGRSPFRIDLRRFHFRA
jgi:hypothetical protein